MSYSGNLSGDIYSHCWFYESARRSFNYEDYGDTCGGITAIALTAFMVESYLNLSCKLIFDLQSRVTEILDDPPSDFYDVIDGKSLKGMDINDRVAVAFGYQEQLDKLTSALEKKVFGRKKVDFIQLCAKASFYEIDDKIRFSPKAKFFSLSEALYEDETTKAEHRELIEKLFNLRNTLAHGRSEFVTNAILITNVDDSCFASNTVPPLKASWQVECSLENAKKVFDDSCEIIQLLSLSAFKHEHPFRMPTQIGAFTRG
ncbi:hypothetical protein [Shewanella sp. GutDb-MelDb]|uniref:hypothetical protein n=1 Tax=Shewanella sp. GutDb-MelDb TaxID=2058316 RepID=UPI000C7E0E83|nr:hypothetical protein [Shewanella sp. GutDb-MelDb]PKG56338.1 hypothetical protein CXF82_15355 [Shewanella sp. GutDb-MelDb]